MQATQARTMQIKTVPKKLSQATCLPMIYSRNDHFPIVCVTSITHLLCGPSDAAVQDAAIAILQLECFDVIHALSKAAYTPSLSCPRQPTRGTLVAHSRPGKASIDR